MAVGATTNRVASEVEQDISPIPATLLAGASDRKRINAVLVGAATVSVLLTTRGTEVRGIKCVHSPIITLTTDTKWEINRGFFNRNVNVTFEVAISVAPENWGRGTVSLYPHYPYCLKNMIISNSIQSIANTPIPIRISSTLPSLSEFASKGKGFLKIVRGEKISLSQFHKSVQA